MTHSKIAEYVWLDANLNFRSKSRTLNQRNLKVNKIPDWNYDGSSTGQASGDFSEVLLKPAAVFNCPFRGGNNVLVWCETYLPDGSPTESNTRKNALEIFSKDLESKPWYGLEQEYFILDPETNKPLGFNQEGKQGQFYCSVGHNNAFGREIAEDHYQKCLQAGIKVSGINAEVAPGQWEYQVGPCVGIDAGDHLYMARYIMERVAENNNVLISYHPKELEGNWNGSGCHTNFSTKNMREGNKKKNIQGIKYINDAITKLEDNHMEHMNAYGEDNNLRMSGEHETSDYNTFSSGVGNRGASVRIPTDTEKSGKGYFEDRRPSSNCDPYLVTGKLFETTVLHITEPVQEPINEPVQEPINEPVQEPVNEQEIVNNNIYDISDNNNEVKNNDETVNNNEETVTRDNLTTTPV